MRPVRAHIPIYFKHANPRGNVLLSYRVKHESPGSTRMAVSMCSLNRRRIGVQLGWFNLDLSHLHILPLRILSAGGAGLAASPFSA